MPYILQEARDYLNSNKRLSTRNSGEANYLITQWLHKNFTNYASVNQMAAMIEKFISRYKHSLPMCDFRDLRGLEERFAGDVLNRFAGLSDDDVVGALRCAWDEFYARKVRPYEDLKIEENGDV